MKRLFNFLLLIIFFGLGVVLTYNYMSRTWEEKTTSSSNVLLEQVKTVCKQVTVEATVNQRYDETNIRQLFQYLPFTSTKTASILVSGTVLVGYDMDQIKITADAESRLIQLSNLPEPEILAIDHNVAYEDLEEGWFNSYKASDFTALNQNARNVLEEKTREMGLLEKAQEEGNQMVEVIRFITESAGWTLQVEGESIILKDDELSN